MLASRFYQSSPLFSFVFHSFLPYHVGDDMWYACNGFGVGAVLAGALVVLFFAWNGSQTFDDLEAKLIAMIHCVKATHPLLYQ